MLLLLLSVIAQAQTANPGTDPATIIAALGGLAVGLAALVTAFNRQRRRRADEDDEDADPVSAIRQHITALESALRTRESEVVDLVMQRDDCRKDRDRYKHELELKTAQHNLALAQLGDYERQLAEERRRHR